jgi:hypothetical protein
MNVVFRHENAIYAANINEWVIAEGNALIALNHSEFDEIEYDGNEWTMDGSTVEILEMTPDIRKYL